MTFGAVILAAGLSSRMGDNKLLLPLGHQRVIEYVIEGVKASKINKIIMVTGRDHDQLSQIAAIQEIPWVHNPLYVKGQSTSVAAGLRAIHETCLGVFFLMGDQPLIQADILNGMMAQFEATKASIIVPFSDEGRGSPVLFGKEWFPQLLEVTGDRGGRQIIRDHPEAVDYYYVEDPTFFLDVDNDALYGQIKRILE